MPNSTIHIVGAGLAGSECAFQLAEMGHQVILHEMRPSHTTPAHQTEQAAELVCSNSFGSQTDYSAPGQLKWEARQLGSLNLACAQEAKVPSGMALGVDRKVFSHLVTQKLKNHPRITWSKKRIESIKELPRPAVIATGPLTDPLLSESLREHFDNEFLYFFDAIAPIIDADTINSDITWKGDRYGKGDNDYINCPLNQDQYFRLIEEIKAARKIEPKDFEITPYFEGCMPIEEIVSRGDQTLRFGPLSPKGLTNPKNDQKYYAVVQLRQENLDATAYGMVGFQTRMAYGEQKRVFQLIPGLEEAEFYKLGSIHRNLYIQSPKRLTPSLSSLKDPSLFFAGQITGVEGYFESTCIGLMVAHFVSDHCHNRPTRFFPRETAMGSLHRAITEDFGNFQPTNINFSLFPTLKGHQVPRGRSGRLARREIQLSIAKEAFKAHWQKENLPTNTDKEVDAII